MLHIISGVLSAVWIILGVTALLTQWSSRSAKVIFVTLASTTAVLLFAFGIVGVR